jgi:hypothetical protein
MRQTLNKVVVTYGDIHVTVTYKTPRTEMRFNSLQQKFLSFYKELASALNEDETAVFRILHEWSEVASIVESIEGELDFIFPVGEDSSETIHEKFMAYLDTAFYGIVDAILQASREMERPRKAHLAPYAVVTDEKKSKIAKVYLLIYKPV